MIPVAGQRVRLSSELVVWAKDIGHIAICALDGIWGTVDSVAPGAMAEIVISVSFRVGSNTISMKVAVYSDGQCLLGGRRVAPFTQELMGDPCPRCGKLGVRVPMACVCRNPGCGQGVIWGI